MGLKNIVNKIFKEKGIDVIQEEFDFNKCIKSLAAIDDEINTILENYEPKTKVEIKGKKESLVF